MIFLSRFLLAKCCQGHWRNNIDGYKHQTVSCFSRNQDLFCTGYCQSKNTSTQWKIHVNDLMLLGNQGQTRLYFKHVLCKCIFFNSQTLNRYWLAAVDQEHGGKEDGFNPCNCLNRDWTLQQLFAKDKICLSVMRWGQFLCIKCFYTTGRERRLAHSIKSENALAELGWCEVWGSGEYGRELFRGGEKMGSGQAFWKVASKLGGPVSGTCAGFYSCCR